MVDPSGTVTSALAELRVVGSVSASTFTITWLLSLSVLFGPVPARAFRQRPGFAGTTGQVRTVLPNSPTAPLSLVWNSTVNGSISSASVRCPGARTRAEVARATTRARTDHRSGAPPRLRAMRRTASRRRCRSRNYGRSASRACRTVTTVSVQRGRTAGPGPVAPRGWRTPAFAVPPGSPVSDTTTQSRRRLRLPSFSVQVLLGARARCPARLGRAADGPAPPTVTRTG